jgi:glycosyltransferase involved in cell wall biosynthesis
MPKAYPLFNVQVKAVFGGAEVDLYLLATELAKDKGFAVSFITADYGQPPIETITGVKIVKSLDFKKNVLSGVVRIWRAMRQAEADIYFQEAASAGTFLVALFCRLYGRVFAYRTANQGECDGTYVWSNRLVGWMFAWALRQAGLVSTQNEIDRTNLDSRYGVKAVVIRNGQHIPDMITKKREFVLWVGRSTPLKRPELFVRLAKEFPAEKFVMICQQATGDAAYEKLAKESEATANLTFIRRVNFDEVEKYFAQAKVLVNTSDSEGFPNVFVQACMYAIPILSLNVNPDKFLGKYNCGKCAKGDWETFKNMLMDILDSAAADRYGLSARKYAEQNHDIKKITEQYKAIFCKSIRDEK